ncbi:hypothetical protein D3C81_827030 [compost metagenome]
MPFLPFLNFELAAPKLPYLSLLRTERVGSVPIVVLAEWDLNLALHLPLRQQYLCYHSLFLELNQLCFAKFQYY